MNDSTHLPEELLWAEGGHASDVVLNALADGEGAIVPSEVRAHVERCTVCTTHLGNAALLALHVGDGLEAVAEQARIERRRPFPWRAVAGGLVVAALGLLPSAAEGSALRSFVAREAPLLLRSAGTVALRWQRDGGPLALVLPYATAALLLAMGFAVTRFMPKKETSR